MWLEKGMWENTMIEGDTVRGMEEVCIGGICIEKKLDHLDFEKKSLYYVLHVTKVCIALQIQIKMECAHTSIKYFAILHTR